MLPNPFLPAPTKPRKTKADEAPEHFSLEEYTASLDPFTLQERIEAESSLYRWCQVVLGYDAFDQDEYCRWRLYEPIHKPMCDRVEQVLPIRGRERRLTQKKLLDLEPRKCLKTYLISAGSALYYLVFNYNGRELIVSHNSKSAKDILRIIKWHMEFNPKFLKFYGNWAYFAKRYGVWRDDSIELGFRTSAIRELTIDTAGAEVSKTGGHYDVIIVDDIQNRENSATETERANVRGRFQEYFPQLMEYGGMLVPATRYHKQDAYGWIMKRREDAIKTGTNPDFLFDVYVHSAWNEDGSLYYPYGLNASFLAQQEAELEEYLFACWYKNDPIEESAKVFKNPRSKERDFDFFRDYVPFIVFPSGRHISVRTVLAWDPAGRESTSKRRDAHGLTVNGTDSTDIWWTIDAQEYRGPLDELLDKIVAMIVQYGVTELSIETRGAGMQGLYVDLIRPVLEKAGLGGLAIHEWTPGNVLSKDAQIRGLQPRFRGNRWFFRRGYCEPLIEQMDNFPQTDSHDDVLDTYCQHKTVSRPPQVGDYTLASSVEEGFDLEEGTAGQESEQPLWVGRGTPDYSDVA